MLSIMACLIPLQAASATIVVLPAQGTVGSSVSITGFTPGQGYVVRWDNSNLLSGTFPSTGQVIFIIPDTVGGPHNLEVQSPPGSTVYSGTFNVLPSIGINNSSGTVGSTVVVTGRGFASLENYVTVFYDETAVKSGINADIKGTWTASIAIPESPADMHTIDAGGNFYGATSIENRVFTVKPSISISPISGGVGTVITVKGHGFNSRETGIRVTYDSNAVKSDILAGENGSWNMQFTIPNSTTGSHIIDASGSITRAVDIEDAVFSIAPGLTLDQSAGMIGSTVKITGAGFGPGEKGIVILFDGITIKSDIVADNSGQWSTSLSVPEAAYGLHYFDARGNMTNVFSVIDAPFTVQPGISINPAGGNVGDTISIRGTGFRASSSINVTYGSALALSNITTDARGSFSGGFSAPGGQSGPISIKVSDSTGISMSGVFNMDTTPPRIPTLFSPAHGEKVGYIGKTKVNFAWADVTDPSGMTYELQVSPYYNFNPDIISVSGLTYTVYSLAEADALPHGDYYWRVRAVDGAGNASSWSTTYMLSAAYIEQDTLYMIIGGVVLFIILLAVILR